MLAEVLNFQGAKPILGMGSLSYITENEISEESYQEILDNQIEPNAYSISSDGVYIIGYDEGMIFLLLKRETN